MDTNPDPATLAQATAARVSVVTVFVENKRTDGTVLDGYGSRFIIKSRGCRALVLTCFHVLRGSVGFDAKKDKIFVRGIGGKFGLPWQAQGHFIKQHPIADRAIFKLTGLPKKMQELKFVASDDLPVGTSVVAIGYSNPDDVFYDSDDLILTILPALSPGTISGQTLVSKQSSVVKEEVSITCVTECGFSGCPVICSAGVFVVVACGFEQITLAISSETICLIFKEWLKIDEDDENFSLEDMIDRYRIELLFV